MRQLSRYVCVLALVGCDAAPITHTSAEGQFSVLLPTTPRVFSDTAQGRLTRSVHAEGDGALYSVAFNDYYQAPADPARFLLEQHEAQQKRAPGKVALLRPFDFGGVPALEFRVEFSNGTVHHARLYVRGSRLYDVSAFGFPNPTFDDRFFESFVLR